MNATRAFSVAILTFLSVPALLGQPALPPPPPPVPTPVPPPPPAVIVQTPMPVTPVPGVAVTVTVPDNYIWDGYEYVGVIGDQYYYLGPGDVWLPLASDRLLRFRNWERAHHEWRAHAIRNELYRRDAQGHDHPWHDRDHDGH